MKIMFYLYFIPGVKFSFVFFFFTCSPRNNILLNMPMFVGSQSFISLPSLVFVSAPVSEIREWKQEEKKKKNSVSNLRPFVGI